MTKIQALVNDYYEFEGTGWLKALCGKDKELLQNVLIDDVALRKIQKSIREEKLNKIKYNNK